MKAQHPATRVAAHVAANRRTLPAEPYDPDYAALLAQLAFKARVTHAGALAVWNLLPLATQAACPDAYARLLELDRADTAALKAQNDYHERCYAQQQRVTGTCKLLDSSPSFLF